MIAPTSSVFAVTDITKKCTAIVRFGPSGTAMDGIKSGEYFQVTIDPTKVSPSGEYIRFGETGGDEIMGWQRAAAISVVEILGDWIDGERSDQSFKFGTQGKVTMPVASDDK